MRFDVTRERLFLCLSKALFIYPWLLVWITVILKVFNNGSIWSKNVRMVSTQVDSARISRIWSRCPWTGLSLVPIILSSCFDMKLNSNDPHWSLMAPLLIDFNEFAFNNLIILITSFSYALYPLHNFKIHKLSVVMHRWMMWFYEVRHLKYGPNPKNDSIKQV